MTNRFSKNQWPLKTHHLLLAMVIVGAGLLLWQYASGPSLWLDEIAVARNIVDRSAWDLLTSPLAYDQVAPKGFLLVEKLAVSVLGTSDYVLRLFPLISSLTALVVFWRVTTLALDDGAAFVAVALFATAAPFMVFASTVKQYSADIAVAVLLLWTCLWLDPGHSSPRRLLWAGLVGGIAVWFSQPAAIAVVALGAGLSVIWWREVGRRELRALIPMLGVWGVSAGLATYVGLASMTPATHAYMNQYWNAGFLPLSPRHFVELLWPLDQLKALFGTTTGFAALTYPVPELYVTLTVLGFGILWWQRRRVAILLVAPLGLTLAAAIAHQYPFSDRLILFLVPTFFLAIATSVEWLRRATSQQWQPLGWLVVALLVGPAIYPIVTMPPVYHREDMRPVLAHLQANRRPGDAVYVYLGAGPAVAFYAKEYGLGDSDYAVGGCHRLDGRQYLAEIDTFRGRRRVWLVVTHAIPAFHERENMVRYLDAIGIRNDAFAVQSHLVGNRGLAAELFLYDLSSPERLGSTTATSFTMIPSTADARFVCGAGPDAMVPAHGV